MSMARVASMVSNVNFLIGDANGNILLTTDEQFVNKTITLPADVTQQIVSEGCYEGRTRLGSMYQLKQYVVGVPAVDSQSGELVGIILAVMENRSLMQMWRSFIGLFFMTSAIILLIAFVVSSLTSMRQIQPIREMVQATRAYGSGEFDVRMQDSDRTDEIGELAASFNAMADSLQETERQRRDFIANISHELKTPMTTIARLYRRHPRRNDPARTRAAVSADHLRREPPSLAPCAPHARHLPDSVEGDEEGGVRPLRKHAPGASVHGAEDQRARA